MGNKILKLFDRPGWRWILFPLIGLMYFLKGNGWATARYFSALRAWAFRVRGVVYLSPGPGWAYSFDYLHKLLLNTYCKFYQPQQGDCIVDLGAGLGEETVIFAQLVGKQGKVYAVEANPMTHDALVYLCSVNGFDQVQPLNIAIAREEGFVQIENDPHSYVGNTIQKESTGRDQFSVQAMSFDLFVQQQGIKRIDLLKSNIEGAEQYLVAGMGKSIHLVRRASVSCHDFRHKYHEESEFYATKAKVLDFFKNNNFEIRANITGHPVNDDIVYAINKNFEVE